MSSPHPHDPPTSATAGASRRLEGSEPGDRLVGSLPGDRLEGSEPGDRLVGSLPGDRLEVLRPDDPFDRSRLGEQDLYLFAEGSHRRLADKLGAHPRRTGSPATRFALWAPSARAVAVMGDFDGWDPDAHPLAPVASSGIWHGVVDGVGPGAKYKFAVTGADGRRVDKADPVAMYSEVPPATASVVWDLAYQWGDSAFVAERGSKSARDAPVSIYEAHLGSWRRDPARPDRLLGYREIAPLLVEHLTAGGFTHVELLPIMEHPFYGSWGYQCTGYFAPTARHGAPQDLMALIDALHQAGIAVILDWVPSHFPTDEFALGAFDGTHLYEHADTRQGIHPDWGSYIFNYDRHEVRSFLLSSAEHWLGAYHADGLRVDAVASMLYLDYSRAEGQWIPNRHGGRENLGAIDFLRQLNTGVYAMHPGAQTFAEESTAWPQVSRPVDGGGLGFGYKWDMGWMHDTLAYMAHDPVHRRWHHDQLTFRAVYAFSENYVLPLSHDEVVHGKGSLLAKMPGDDWQQRANLRLLLGYQFTLPGKKLLFMGDEIGQRAEWSHETSVDWHLLDDPGHLGIWRWVGDLNRLYRRHGALHELDCEPAGFEWIRADDHESSTLAFLRWSASGQPVLVAANFTPVVRAEVDLGAPVGGYWHELANSDAQAYGGSGVGNLGGVDAEDVGWRHLPHRLLLTLPPLAVVVLAPGPRPEPEPGPTTAHPGDMPAASSR